MAVTKETVITEPNKIEDLLTKGRNPANRYSEVELTTREDTEYPRGGGLRINTICSEQVEEDGRTYREYKAHLVGDPSPGHRFFTIHAVSRLIVKEIYATEPENNDMPIKTNLEITLKKIEEQKQQTNQRKDHGSKNRRNGTKIGNDLDYADRYMEEAE